MSPTTGVENDDAETRNKSPPGNVLINENDSEDSDSDLSSFSDEDDIDSILKKTLIVPRAFYTRKLQWIPTLEEVRRRRTVKGIIEHCTTSLTDSNSPVHLLKAVGDAIQAMRELHAQCYMQHGDISPANVKFYEDKKGSPIGVLYDFDHYTEHSVKTRTYPNTPSDVLNHVKRVREDVNTRQSKAKAGQGNTGGQEGNGVNVDAGVIVPTGVETANVEGTITADGVMEAQTTAEEATDSNRETEKRKQEAEMKDDVEMKEDVCEERNVGADAEDSPDQ